MKIAIFSDIHANHNFLTEFFKLLDALHIERVFCLGDLVGYYDEPNEVIKSIRYRNITCIKGNHEKYLLGELKYDYKKEHIYNIKLHKKKLTAENLNFLESLPDEIDLNLLNKRFYMTHSLPGDCQTYAYHINKIDKSYLSKYDYYCYGHTHIPLVTYSYGTCILNPGSIGQPRDYTKLPSFIMIDLKENHVSLRKLSVSSDNYINKLIDLKYSTNLIRILQRECK